MPDRGGSRRRAALAARTLRTFRPSWRWLRDVVRSFVISFLALALTLRLVPGTQVPENGLESVATLVVTVLLLGALLRPLLTGLTVITGLVGLLLAGFLAQALILGVALSIVPGVESPAWPEIILVAWGMAAIAALLNWIVDTSSEEVFLSQVMGRAIATARRADASGPGLLVVQLDGVGEPLIRQAAASGAVPYLSGLLRSGSHRLSAWHTGLPSTTPAGQAQLLHGDDHVIPGFRWYDKELGRMVTCNRPGDAGAIERILSNGNGFLADEGASVSNLFSGDAPFRAITMSKPSARGTRPGAAEYAVARTGMVRSLVLLIGQIITEWFQGRRQRRRGVQPRVNRTGAFLFLRGLTTVVLRDLTVAIVADQLARGAPAIYVDLLDYDEVAHHAGPTRPEAMRTLEGLDRVVRFFHEVAEECGRDYEIVVVSDHGQTQGATFLQIEGRPLVDVVRELVVDAVVDADDAEEALGAAQLLHSHERTPSPLRPAVERMLSQPRSPRAPATVEVAVSGSLAHLYLTEHPGRLSREAIDHLAPKLLPGLSALSGVGVVMTRREDGTLIVENESGWRELSVFGATGGSGDDPLAVYGPIAGDDLVSLDARANVGDVVLLGRYDADLNEVAAFEELDGSHGGLGGWQTEALFVHPIEWDVPTDRLSGVDVHRMLVDRLAVLGLRSERAVS